MMDEGVDMGGEGAEEKAQEVTREALRNLRI